MLKKEDAKRIDMYEKGDCKNKQYVYNCLKCEKEIKVRSNKLESHSGICFDCTVSGRRLRPYESTYNAVSGRVDSDAKKLVSISYEEFLEFVEIKNCHYCGHEVEWNEYRNHHAGKTGCSNLDRINSALGYSKDNIVVCCSRCNYFKSSYVSYEAMMKIGPILEEYNTGSWYRGGHTGPVAAKPKADKSKSAHKGQSTPNKTGFVGVHEDRARGLWIAKAKKNGKIIFLGRFKTTEEAARAYDKYATETYGSEANLNFPLTTNTP